MSLLVITTLAAVPLVIAYFTYGTLLTRLLRLRPDVATPAVELRDDVDYVPIESKFLLSQHFSAIAAAGPIVGPILAGVQYGWLPAILWILLGSIFIGGVHDFTALVASVRHKARSIAEVVRDHMSRRAYLLFLSFVWVALVYIIVAFTDVTASAFHGVQTLENGDKISGGGIATSSLLYLILPMIMGVLLRYQKMTVGVATAVFLPLVGLSIWAGQYMPIEAESLFRLSAGGAQKFWNITLLVYCVIASIIPMWLLLQPRGHLGGYFLYAALFAGFIGVVFGGQSPAYPAIKEGITLFSLDAKDKPLAPLLFITIACGACSGFHSIIASGTTSKQLRCEPDAKVIGYGAMLLEAMVAIVSLCCLMKLKPDSPLLTQGNPEPNLIYAQGIGSFISLIGVPAKLGVSFGLMAFTTFVYDTLDVCTRLGRYILQELTGWQGAAGRWIATLLTAGVPMIFLVWQPTTVEAVPAWKLYWNLFGASNQLLAALTLLGVTVWLWRTYHAKWVLVVTGIPCVFMYIMSMWALLLTLWPLVHALRQGDFGSTVLRNPVPWVASLLAVLGMLLLLEAIWVCLRGINPPAAPSSEPVAVAT